MAKILGIISKNLVATKNPFFLSGNIAQQQATPSEYFSGGGLDLPGFCDDAQYVLDNWCIFNQVKAESATEEFTQRFSVPVENHFKNGVISLFVRWAPYGCTSH